MEVQLSSAHDIIAFLKLSIENHEVTQYGAEVKHHDKRGDLHDFDIRSRIYGIESDKLPMAISKVQYVGGG